LPAAAIRALHQPGPAGAEVAGGGFAELILELGHRAERLVDRVGELAGGFAATVRAHRVPVESVVPGLRGVVEDAAGRLADDVLEFRVGELGAFDLLVEVGHIGLVVLAVVVLERLGGDVRLQCILFVRKRGKFDGHERLLGMLLREKMSAQQVAADGRLIQ